MKVTPPEENGEHQDENGMAAALTSLESEVFEAISASTGLKKSLAEQTDAVKRQALLDALETAEALLTAKQTQLEHLKHALDRKRLQSEEKEKQQDALQDRLEAKRAQMAASKANHK